MSRAAYSDLKGAWHLDRIAALREGRRVAPIEMQVMLSDLCNHDCFFCAYRSETGLSAEHFVEYKDGERLRNPNRMIPRDDAVALLQDAAAAGVKSIIWTGGGEPTVHPHHMFVFQKALDLGLECSLNTNGNLLRFGWESVLPQFKYVRVSIDAGSARDYALTRRVPEHIYELVLNNVKKLVKETAGTDCVVGTGFVVTTTNWQNLVEGVVRIRDTGAQYVRVASMQSTEGMKPFWGIEEEVRHEIRLAKRLETDRFKVVDLFNQTQGNKADGPLCGMQHLVLYVAASLKLYRCCYTAYTTLGEIGDLTKQSLQEWFNDPKSKRLLDEFDARSCATCPLESKNAVIRYVADPDPLHVNFV